MFTCHGCFNSLLLHAPESCMACGMLRSGCSAEDVLLVCCHSACIAYRTCFAEHALLRLSMPSREVCDAWLSLRWHLLHLHHQSSLMHAGLHAATRLTAPYSLNQPLMYDARCL